MSMTHPGPGVFGSYERSKGNNTRKYQELHQAEAIPYATKNGNLWTGPELEFVFLHPEMRAVDLAKALGRTFAAVVGARARLRQKDPKTMYLLGRTET